MENKMYKILRLNLKDAFKDEDNEVVIKINEDNLKKCFTLVKESETIRIIRALDNDNNSLIDGYTYIKDLIAIKSYKQTYQSIVKEVKGIIKVQFYRLKEKENCKSDKKEYEEENTSSMTFKRFMSSSGNVKNKKIIFIKEDLFNKANEILLCGLDDDMEHDTFSKYNSYYAMAQTDSTPVAMPNKIVVIDDYEHMIKENFDVVEEIGKDKYKVTNNISKKFKMNCFDGAGLVDISLARIWSKDLELDYIPSSWQFRAIPSLKGNVYTFNIKEFAKQHKIKDIKDICGNTWNIDVVDCILTKSQFKFYKQYVEKYGQKDAISKWEEEFNKECNGYKRTFNISKYSEKFSELKEKTILSYQPLQSLNLNIDDIKQICEDTVEFIKKISTDVTEFLKYRGIISSKENENGEIKQQQEIPSYYKALAKDHSLFHTDFMQKKIKKDINSFKERSTMGGIFVKGNYQTWIPDPLALAEWACGLKVKGGLNKHEVYNKYWMSKGIKKIDIIRFPHVSNEHVISKVKNPNTYWIDGNKIIHSWYEYMTEGIVTNIYDSSALKIGGSDFDNDHVLSNTTLLKYAKKQQTNTILPLAKPKSKEKVNKEDGKKELKKINDMDELIDTDIRAMNASIGEVINKITKLWMLSKDAVIKDELTVADAIKIMSVVGSRVIDFAKHGVMACVPKEIDNFLKDINKPVFQSIKYKKQLKDNETINKFRRIIGEEVTEKFDKRDCTMNRLYNYMSNQIKDIELDMEESCKTEKEFNFVKLYNVEQFNIYNQSFKLVRAKLLKMKLESDIISKKTSMEKENTFCMEDDTTDIRWRIFNTACKCELMDLLADKKLNMDKETLVNYMVYIFFEDKKFMQHCQDYSLLWNIFGSELNQRLKNKKLITRPSKLSNEKRKNRQIKNKANVRKLKSNAKKVFISKFNPSEESKAPNEIVFYKEEIKVIKKEFKYIKDLKEREYLARLLIALLSISKFNMSYAGSPIFKLESGKKNAITQTHVCKLAKIDVRNFERLMKELSECKLVKFTIKKDGLEIEIKIDAENVINIKEKITDINDTKKLFR